MFSNYNIRSVYLPTDKKSITMQKNREKTLKLHFNFIFRQKLSIFNKDEIKKNIKKKPQNAPMW